jgi:Pyruvate/2-oxoglutarate dehydrogenase complex, dihydrolipoamide acyltransferase (E2) component, and related enzymes
MAFAVNMPRLGLNEEENVLCEWFVNEGDAVAVSDKLFSIETDKSNMEVYSEHAGTVLKRLYEEFSVVPVMTAVCVIGNPGEDISSIISAPQTAALQTENTAASDAAVENSKKTSTPEQPSVPVQPESVAKAISPRARKLADANGIQVNGIKPTGAEGRIVEEDVLNAMKSAPQRIDAPSEKAKAPASASFSHDGKTVKTSNIRRIIAKNIKNSLETAAQTTQHIRFNASKLQDYRAWLKSAPGPEKNVTRHDLISFITVKTLVNFDYMNAHMRTIEELTTFESVHLGCAVGTAKGLLVPTVKNAQDMNLMTFASTMKTLIQKARDGKITPDEMADATFTVSNLGSYGITTFTPILNPPQVGILGVGTIDYIAKKTPEGFLHHPAGYLSLTYDHRAMDGVPAAEFLRALCDNLESMDMLSLGD